MVIVMKMFSTSLLLVSFSCFSFTSGKDTSEFHNPAFANANQGEIHTPAFANANQAEVHTPAFANAIHAEVATESSVITENENNIAEDKSPLHEPAISVGKPVSAHSSPHEHSSYHIPAMANGQSSHIFHQHPHSQNDHSSPVHATIVTNKNPDNSSGIGAAIVTAHRNPLFPGGIVSGISSYSNSNSEHIPAVAVSGVTTKEHPVAISNPSNRPLFPHLSGYASFGAHPTYHQTHTHTPALATPSNTHREGPVSIWDKASTHGAEHSEKTVLKFPLTFSAMYEFSKPLWSNLRSYFPTKVRSVDLDRDLEASLPPLNETDFANNTNLMKFEEIVQTNRQKWEIPIDEEVMKSPEFKNFWVVYKQYLEQQLLLLQSNNPQKPAQQSSQAQAAQPVIDSLPRPESSNHVYDGYLDAHRYCQENTASPYALFVEDADSCGQFFKCYKGNAYHFHCAKGTSFSSAANMCLYKEDVDCGLRP